MQDETEHRVAACPRATAGEPNRQPEIQTDRLLLRRFEPEDADEVRRLANNRNVSKTTLNIPYPYEPGVAEKWIGTHARNWAFRTSASWAVTIAAADTLVGSISLTWMNRSMVELGYWIGEPHWGKGYCSEAAAALIEYAFDRLRIERILAEHLRSNPASGRVMTKAGMRRVGTAKRRGRYSKRVDLEVYEIRRPGAAVPEPH